MLYLSVKALHVIFMVTWFAGLFYLPRLFVYHAMADNEAAASERFKVMERKLYAIMGIGAVLTVLFGVWMIWLLGASAFAAMHWLHVKIALVVLLGAYHLYLGRLVRTFKDDRNVYGHVFYRWLNELPVLILFPVVFLAILKPVLG
jgi:putative membrane protein